MVAWAMALSTSLAVVSREADRPGEARATAAIPLS
jgi:hypothetical protein